MEKWARIKYQPCLPIGDNNSRITGSKRHIELSRRAASEGIVLLKNNNTALPLKEGSRVAVFGNAQFDYIKGGGGSGDVHSEYVINIYDGIKTKKSIEVFEPLSLYYKECVLKQYKEGEYNNKLRYGILYGMLDEVEIPEKLLCEAREFTDTAIITICRFSGEGWDRKNEGDAYFELSSEEKNMVEVVSASFDKVIVLLNTGSMIDTSWFYNNDRISSVLMIWQGGMEGGLAVADVLTGEENPSGKLADTCAMSFNDYPSSEGYYESKEYVKYTEDIFVGYRYFETIPEKKERVVYPFGYGLSYTAFEISDISTVLLDGEISISASVKNVGAVSGKEVIQVYFEAPVGKMTKASRELCAFKKTSLLSAGESERVVVSFKVSDMASFDDTGVIEK
ncbi:MAG: glycoside hydrolase family 3 C-terminal domain-containing protein, partial [Clostridia bacterium]|nr:glycoside hydrolase family 3 C-terminal domain-containing protein [Clostridia bacterium]